MFIFVSVNKRKNDKRRVALFDLDGVVADTESLYDIFWEGIAEKYHIDVPDFASKIKGTTLQHIYHTYFAACSADETDRITSAIIDYERDMSILSPGIVEFFPILKQHGYRLGLVTSSSMAKMQIALKKMGLESGVDTLVTADRITEGKPDPMCYLLAAADLQVQPDACVVFEDSFAGIQAGKAAGMRVVGLATTYSREAILDQVDAVIPDFQNAGWVLDLM
ncbi:MAG: HAD family phosphatase [Odoribacter sp.]